MLKGKRTLFTFVLSLCLLLNFSAKALQGDECLSFQNAASIRSTDLLIVPAAETPAPAVTVYLPRNDFASGKSKSTVDAGRALVVNTNKFNSAYQFTFPSGIHFQVPVYLLNNVFRI